MKGWIGLAEVCRVVISDAGVGYRLCPDTAGTLVVPRRWTLSVAVLIELRILLWQGEA